MDASGTYWLGSGIVGPDAFVGTGVTRSAIQVALKQLPLHEIQRECASYVGPIAYAATSRAQIQQLVKPTALARILKPSLAARKPVRRIAKGDVHGKRGAIRFLRGLDFGELAPGTVGGGEGGNTSGTVNDGSGGPPPGMYFKPDADGGKFVPLPSGWPPPAAYRPGNWNFEDSKYALAFGDTLSGLAITYLGSPQRWKEIWDANPQDWRWSHKPDKLMAGTWIVMPFEARDRAKAMLVGKQSAPPAPSTIGKKAPIDVPGEDKNAPTVEGGTKAVAGATAKKWVKPALIAGGVVAGVGIIYAIVS